MVLFWNAAIIIIVVVIFIIIYEYLISYNCLQNININEKRTQFSNFKA